MVFSWCCCAMLWCAVQKSFQGNEIEQTQTYTHTLTYKHWTHIKCGPKNKLPERAIHTRCAVTAADQNLAKTEHKRMYINPIFVQLTAFSGFKVPSNLSLCRIFLHPFNKVVVNRFKSNWNKIRMKLTLLLYRYGLFVPCETPRSLFNITVK